ncbi:hypothetical protein COV17_03380 [Candidatus Woesearchaeota archaeon CG10_big_fil_rev_8_21_14_0_10_36_11]|nr:MAG: hypothetical protein COV17_03380 [Candidatus Woesearchaeota archaeon CG10_big_fil_rev_8_21_14_0_10_36_11]
MNKLILLLGAICGFTISYFLSGKTEGQQGIIKSFIFTVGQYNVHIHHWIIALIILIALLYFGFYNDFVHGLLLGLIIQGLMYRDFYKFISHV